MAGAKIALTSTTGELKNDGAGNALVNMPGNSASGATVGGGPETAGHVTIQSENDPGVATGERYVLSPETSDDYRLRVGRDSFLDNETFNYTNQNTAKFGYTATTLVMALSGGFAEGGRPPVGRPALVGEKGPELFVPDRPGTVIPNDVTTALSTMDRMQSGGGSRGSEEAAPTRIVIVDDRNSAEAMRRDPRFRTMILDLMEEQRA